ncbi:hypothetical protein BD626DRAFT_575756 [Schizophyllum amplum]|uniref:Uncharacterized protein n=1 Tax=Schizophyllum amplum TaxID=97359 RepID=A0A550BUX5_9AGAR|nr:hypothetical protein BD626DRAFT_575756 [Auriculariopsis ampla]
MASGHFGLLPELAPEVFFYSDQHTMSAWSLVARYFTPLAQPVLYSTFILGGYKLEHPALPESGYIVNVDHDHFVRGARHLSDHPHLRSYVRRLVLGVCVADGAQSYDADGSQSYDEDGVLVRHAGGLDAGAIDNLTSTLLLQGYLPNLTDLHLHPCNPPQDRRPPFLRCPPFLMPYHMNDMFRSRITSSTISRLVFHNFEIGGWKAGHILELLVTGDVHDVALVSCVVSSQPLPWVEHWPRRIPPHIRFSIYNCTDGEGSDSDGDGSDGVDFARWVLLNRPFATVELDNVLQFPYW